ncbi:c-type heme family protein [Gimesia algae]|uniref:Tll0287-like domain-containing protein n=1 Tax=Gimesia algae TaxID=2527971 RepID=A0A517VHK7_9PLAN|nr:DUF3365 domain-containing protein [Gimesia algae]QDT92491.1 hypothetical protein Pan161_41580 [Gimesia algae]
MKAMLRICTVISISVFSFGLVSFAEPPENGKEQKGTIQSSTTKQNKRPTQALSLAQARERAELTHILYSATLDAMHQSYFINERAAVPARVMERMFKEVENQENIKARWIAVNARAMSVDHEPETEFEKQAAEELASGKAVYERVENGVFQRAGSISLMNHGCLTCHVGFGKQNKKERFAGLIISIPVKSNPVKVKKD